MCLLMEEYTTTYEVLLAKNKTTHIKNFKLNKPLDPNTNL